MPCYSPRTGFQHISGGPLVWRELPDHRPITVACGQCIGCRLRRSREWGIRCVHEAQEHEQNCFLTLTYSDENLPRHGSLYKPDLQKFWKRLRKELGKKIRYYACGEYGEQTQRPHYHACLFGHDFADKTFYKRTKEHDLYVSKTLDEIWGLGGCTIGRLEFDTAMYTASYVMKKQFGNTGGGYVRIAEGGEIIPLVQPFACMSLRPAIGQTWLLKHFKDVYWADKDFVILKGHKLRPPRYYDKIYDEVNPDRMAHIKKLRTEKEGMTDNELRAHAKITRARTKTKNQI